MNAKFWLKHFDTKSMSAILALQVTDGLSNPENALVVFDSPTVDGADPLAPVAPTALTPYSFYPDRRLATIASQQDLEDLDVEPGDPGGFYLASDVVILCLSVPEMMAIYDELILDLQDYAATKKIAKLQTDTVTVSASNDFSSESTSYPCLRT